MNYSEEYNFLKKVKESSPLSEQQDCDFEFTDVNFKSCKSLDFSNNLTENNDTIFNALLNYYLHNNSASNDYIFRNLNAPDNSFDENNNFSYTLVRKKNSIKSNSVIILLHGLNEKDWDKYLPWAKYLIEKTGKAVILFPLAFHMNRAPAEWSNSRLMFKLSRERMLLFPNLESSSFVNAALSTRLQFSPERFLLSGLQTLYDIIQLVEEIRNNQNKFINADASIDYFGYSIGGFLGQILMMSNPANMLADSRLLVFCGGSTLDNSAPVSRSIIDSEAANALFKYYLEYFDKSLKKDTEFKEIFAKSEEIGVVFKSMIDSSNMVSFRNALAGSLKDKIKIVLLGKDKVFTPICIEKSYPGRLTKSVKCFDYDCNYSHETPFPLVKKYEDVVNKAFLDVFSYSADFLA